MEFCSATHVGIMGGGSPPPPALPGGGGGPRPPGGPGAALGGCGGCRETGGGARRAPGDVGAFIDDELGGGREEEGIQSLLMGGGAGVLTVAMETSPMILRAFLQAWYCRSISSRLIASSALSSIIDCCERNFISFTELSTQSIWHSKRIVPLNGNSQCRQWRRGWRGARC